MSGQTLAEVLAAGLVDFWCADLDPEEAAYVREMPETAEAVAASVPHLADAVTAWVEARLTGAREDVVRTVAQMEPDEIWPTNESLGGGLTGTRDDEYRAAMEDEADAALAVVRGALGIEVGS